MRTPFIHLTSGFRRSLARVGAVLVVVATVSFAGQMAAGVAAKDWERDLSPATAMVDVARGGGEIMTRNDTSLERAAGATSDDAIASGALSGRARGGRSCSTLVLQNDE